MSERLKLRRKRIGGGSTSTSTYQPTNRVNKFLSQAIEARSVDREKANHVNLFSLCFRDPEKERQVGLDVKYNKIILIFESIFDTLDFDQSHFDQLHFDQFYFDQFHFDQSHFDQLSL